MVCNGLPNDNSRYLADKGYIDSSENLPDGHLGYSYWRPQDPSDIELDDEENADKEFSGYLESLEEPYNPELDEFF